MFYFPFVDDIKKTKTYFDLNVLAKGITFDKMKKKIVALFNRNIQFILILSQMHFTKFSKTSN